MTIARVNLRGYALKNQRGELLAYWHREYGMRLVRDPKLARYYRTERGARIARGMYRRRDERELEVVPVDWEGKQWDGWHSLGPAP